MKRKLLIAIPSMGRADKQLTLRNLTSIGMKVENLVVVCVPERELGKYERTMREPAKLVGVPDSVQRIAPTRDWIWRNLPKKFPECEGLILQLDDDMDFCYRPAVDSPKLSTVTTSDRLQRMVDTLEGWLTRDKFLHVGISARQGNNRPFRNAEGADGLHPYRDATRMINAYAYDTRRLLALRSVDAGRNAVMHDFDLTLQLLRMGYPNRVLYEYCWNQRGSGAKGGCSAYRDAAMQERSARQLAADHPGFVKVVTKKNKEGSGAWEGMKERVDVIVQWKEAYASSGADR